MNIFIAHLYQISSLMQNLDDTESPNWNFEESTFHMCQFNGSYKIFNVKIFIQSIIYCINKFQYSGRIICSSYHAFKVIIYTV